MTLEEVDTISDPNLSVVSEYKYYDVGTYDYVATKIITRHSDRPKDVVWGESGISHKRLAPYGLQHPDFIYSDDKDLLIVEGEQDVHTAFERGHQAVCLSHSAFTDYEDIVFEPLRRFRGRILIWTDHDATGENHRKYIATKLYSLGHRNLHIVEWDEAPEKGDITDAIELGVDIKPLLNNALAVTQTPLIELLERIHSYITRYIAISAEGAIILALWAVHTYIWIKGAFTPYMFINSAEPDSGKTLVIDVMEPLVLNPMAVGSATVASLRSDINEFHPTLLYDEIDGAVRSDVDGVMRTLLNNGFRKGRGHRRMVGHGGAGGSEEQDLYCPKLFAGLGRLARTVTTRSITIEMQPASAEEQISLEVFIPEEAMASEETKKLREDLAEWAETTNCNHMDTIRPVHEYLASQGFRNRSKDILAPLYQIALEADGDWPKRCIDASRKLLDIEPPQSVGVRALSAIHLLFEREGVDRFSSKELVSLMIGLDDGAWSAFTMPSSRQTFEGALTNHKLAKLLKPYRIKSKNIRLGTTTLKGYMEADFENAFSRYLITRGNSVNNPADIDTNTPINEQDSGVHNMLF